MNQEIKTIITKLFDLTCLLDAASKSDDDIFASCGGTVLDTMIDLHNDLSSAIKAVEVVA